MEVIGLRFAARDSEVDSMLASIHKSEILVFVVKADVGMLADHRCPWELDGR